MAGAELLAGPRGSDLRLDEAPRPTRDAKRQEYADRRAGKQAARAELERERAAGHWARPAEEYDAAEPTTATRP